MKKNGPSILTGLPAICVCLLIGNAAHPAIAQETREKHRARSVSKPEADNSVAAELKSFALADGYQANLFADETDGVANPVCMSWDPAGRLWVLCTPATSASSP